jgi:hypothetical protein
VAQLLQGGVVIVSGDGLLLIDALVVEVIKGKGDVAIVTKLAPLPVQEGVGGSQETNPPEMI